MLAFVDESGDTGFNFEKGSTRFFVVSIVIFEDENEAKRCGDRIKQLKRSLGFKDNFEFHFNSNSDKLRQNFLNAVALFPFSYVSIVIDKGKYQVHGEEFRNRESFYKYACGLVFENAKPYLKNAKVKVDKNGRDLFGSELARHIMRTMNKSGNLVASVKMEPAPINNLLQLADYVSGIVSRRVLQKKDFQVYQGYIAAKEISTQIWPK